MSLELIISYYLWTYYQHQYSRFIDFFCHY